VTIAFEDLGSIGYADAFERQLAAHAEVLRWRDEAEAGEERPFGRVFLLEHDPPVVTVSKRPTAATNLLASPELLAHHGIEVQPTDRGGDITYHGPGQLVVYPILDLRRLKLNLHGYMRLLEQVAINVCAAFGVPAQRDPSATGVWVPQDAQRPDAPSASHPDGAKVCALGVRIRRWVSMHGLALNVSTNLDHFALIVPCGLVGRPVTSLHAESGGADALTIERSKHAMREALLARIAELQAQRG